MDINGKDQVGIFKFIMFYKIDEDQGFSFLRNRGVTYMTKQQVTLIVWTQQVLGFHLFCFIVFISY